MGHDGGVAAGDYCQTLDLTDIATTWTETMAVRNKAQARVFEALQKVRKNLPFPLLGLDSDNVLPARASRLFGDSFPERGNSRYLPSC